MDRQQMQRCLEQAAAYRISGQKAKVWAQAKPAGPAPTTATRLPVRGAQVNNCGRALSIKASTAKRCSRPMATGRSSWV